MVTNNENRESGSVAAIFLFTCLISIFLFIFIAIEMPVIGAFVVSHNTLTQTLGLPLTQEHQASITTCLNAIQTSPLIVFILGCVWCLLQARKSNTNEV